MYYKPETNKIFLSHYDIRNTLTSILFPQEMDDEMLAYHGIFPLNTVIPDFTSVQKLVEASVEEVEGGYSMTYEVVDMTEEEIEAAKPPVPDKVTRRQARSALLLRGLLDQVDIVIAAIPDVATRRLAQIEWQDASEFDRNRALVVQIGTALGLDSKGLDDVFRLANTL